MDGECASFVKHIDSCDALKELSASGKLKQGRFILQDRVFQSEAMNAFNPSSINTYRIMTVNKEGNVYCFSAVLRVGTSKTGNVDNWAAGGLFIGVDIQRGVLKKYGFYKPIYGTKTDVHPDTGVRFEGHVAPQIESAVKIACEAHRYFYGVRTIGWDVAITEDGPVFIEGNDNWEITLAQVADGPEIRNWEQTR